MERDDAVSSRIQEIRERLPFFGSNAWPSLHDDIDYLLAKLTRYEEVVKAARALFPADAEIWNSPRFATLAAALDELDKENE